MAFEKSDRPERTNDGPRPERTNDGPRPERTGDGPRPERTGDGPRPERFGDGPRPERRPFGGDRRGPMGGGPRTDQSRCRTPGCPKYHDFFQWNGKYYCLECYETLRSAERQMTVPA